MKQIAVIFAAILLVNATALQGLGKATSLADARAVIEANLRTPEGKAYDQQFGKEFMQKYGSNARQCKQSASKDLESFWTLLKLDKTGAVREVLLHPETRMGTCLRQSVENARFSPPPRPDYWVGIYLKVTR